MQIPPINKVCYCFSKMQIGLAALILASHCIHLCHSQNYFAGDFLLQFLGSPAQSVELARQRGILQPQLEVDIPFPCALNNTRSNPRPESVHELRPGDIDVVAAIGDSFLSGNGLTATNLLQIGVENRGLAFAIGGRGDWHQFVTLPNILKPFNPNLKGYSVEDTLIYHRTPSLNLGVVAALSQDLPSLARRLIARMKRKPDINIAQDWKLITVLIGANDFCSRMCRLQNPESILEEHRNDLTRALTIIRDNLPRTLVNLIATPNIRTLLNTTSRNLPAGCSYTRSLFCSCLYGSEFAHLQKKFDEIMEKWQGVQTEVAFDPDFDGEDFTVVTQPLFLRYRAPTNKEGLTDYTEYAVDCFHMSQKGSARAAISLWNNLLQPYGSKSLVPSDLFDIKCPTEDQPYIFTRGNYLL